MISNTFDINRPVLLSKLSAMSIAVFLSACTVGPDFKEPAASTSQHYDQQAEQRLDATGNKAGDPHIEMGRKVSDDWWSAFHSPKLDNVVQRAIEGNLELVATSKR